MAPERERTFGVQEPIRHFLECQMALQKGRISMFWALAQWPSGDDKAHHFRTFRKRMRPNSNPNRLYLFLESSGL